MILDSANLTIITGLVYGGIFFLSCAGYGCFLVRLLKIKEPYPLGILACIGIAVIIAFGGAIALAGLISKTVNLIIVFLGFLASIPLFNRLPSHLRSLYFSLRPKIPLGVLILSLRFISAAIIIIFVLGSILPHWSIANDDAAAYFHFPKMMLETGSLLEPFNFRRMASLGGAAYIQSFMYPIFSASALSFTDNAIGMLLLWSVAHGFPGNSKEDTPWHLFRKEALALLTILIAAAIIRVNHFPVILPLAMFFGFMTIAVRFSHDPSKRPNLILLALTAASIVTYRNNFVAFVSLFSVLTILAAYRGTILREKWKIILVFSFVYFLFLLPWLALSYKSSGTLFFPVFKGYYTFPFLLRVPLASTEQLAYIIKNLWFANVFFLGTLVYLALSKRNAMFLLAILASVVISVSITAYQMTAAGTANVSRYCQPFIVPSLLVVFGILVVDGFRANNNFGKITLGASIIVMVGVFINPIITSDVKAKSSMPYRVMEINLGAFLRNAHLLATPGLDLDKRLNRRGNDFSSYVAIQNYLPDNAKILSVTANPFYWNFEKQKINTLDCIGVVSPPPGQPFSRGAAAMTDYFRQLGYQYIVYGPFDQKNSLYNEAKWQRLLRSYSFVFSQWAPFFLEFFDYIRELERRNVVIYRDEHLRVIDLNLT